ncbi:acetylornithine deacetylase [Thalassococcus sp. CAU 1522]|uniref:Acetylornithine deacetylase n=1 Tax=Thalassococcus arenae TaxID=2851652 RepID=A0ABS6N8Q6_9RHOB|nr:acetylornithine deacetylase [Thalassococcus arenae]MBV2360193.1 acetylornithine deacetylase [Thalassococcus arenae]
MTATAILADLVAFPTVSDRPNLALLDYAADHLHRAGARLHHLPAPCGTKANLVASFGPDGPGGVLLSGHVDVVPVDGQNWASDPFTLRDSGDRLYGRGTCDMKGFVACVLAAAPDLAQSRQPLHVTLTHDEEVGCLGARAMMPRLAGLNIAPEIVIVGEPTGMEIVDGHKGCCEYSVTFSGLEGHGSTPDLGANAVAAAARYAACLLDLAEALKSRAPAASPFDPPWTTINIGRLSGGSTHNVIPARAELDWEMRPVRDGDAAFVHEALRAFTETTLMPMLRAAPGAAIATTTIGEVAGLTPQADNPARDLVARLTGRNATHTVPFGTEAGLFQQAGAAVVLCGPGHIAQAHKADEYVSTDQLAQCSQMLARLAQTLR